jgi:hypothetical protein
MSPVTPTPLSLAQLPQRTWPVAVWEAQRRWRACKRKTAYPTPQDAINAALPRLRSAPRLRIYRCERCGHFHLTSQHERSRQP